MVAFKVRELLKQNSLFVPIEAIAIKDLERHIPSSIAYLAVLKTEDSYSIPVIDATAFLTGKNQEEELEKLIHIIQKEQEREQKSL